MGFLKWEKNRDFQTEILAYSTVWWGGEYLQGFILLKQGGSQVRKAGHGPKGPGVSL